MIIDTNVFALWETKLPDEHQCGTQACYLKYP
jgi:hypothetical protein